MSISDPVVEEVLYQGLEDWIALTTIAYLVEDENESQAGSSPATGPEDVKTGTLDRIQFMVDRGLARVGELSNSTTDDNSFLDWPGTTDEIIDRIRDEWEELLSLEHFESCWLRTTEAGKEAGRKVDSQPDE